MHSRFSPPHGKRSGGSLVFFHESQIDIHFFFITTQTPFLIAVGLYRLTVLLSYCMCLFSCHPVCAFLPSVVSIGWCVPRDLSLFLSLVLLAPSLLDNGVRREARARRGAPSNFALSISLSLSLHSLPLFVFFSFYLVHQFPSSYHRYLLLCIDVAPLYHNTRRREERSRSERWDYHHHSHCISYPRT